MKPTVRNLSAFFGVGVDTIQRWKTSRPLVYSAMLKFFKENQNETQNAINE